jgi:hypothetical protein
MVTTMFEEEQTKYQIVKEYFDDKINKTKVFFRSIKFGISNFLYYGKAIWQDRDWDYGYTNNLLLLKLKKQYKLFNNKENVCMEEERRQFILKYMKLAIYFLECIVEEEYMIEEDKKAYSTLKYDWIEITSGPHKSLSEMKRIGGPSDEELDDIHKRGSIRQKKIENLFHRILQTRSGYWWD